MTMRLNLDHILKNQLRDAGEPNNQRLAKADTDKKCLRNVQDDKSDAMRYFINNPDMKTRVNSMLMSIHKYMKTTSPPRKAVPKIPEPIAEIPAQPANNITVTSNKSRRIKGGGGVGIATGNRSHTMPISQMKARITKQSQQLMRRGYSELNTKSFTNQKRIREVMMQKSVLENMLLQHKRLQRDRQNIALDIQRMRQDLDKIKNRLDTSLQTLNSTKTLYGGIVKKKKGMLPIALPKKVVRTDFDIPMSSHKSSTNSNHFVKTGSVITKRQHSSHLKRRIRS